MKRPASVEIHNVVVRLDGRQYRVARASNGRVLTVARKVGARSEHAMDIDGPRAKQVLAALDGQL